jgi:hypothetical protein
MNYQINLTAEDIALIGVGLGKLPFESVSNLITRFQAQIASIEEAAKASMPEPALIPEEATELPTA